MRCRRGRGGYDAKNFPHKFKNNMKLIYTIQDFHSQGEGLLNAYQAANAANEKLAKWKIAMVDMLQARIAIQETEIAKLRKALNVLKEVCNCEKPILTIHGVPIKYVHSVSCTSHIASVALEGK